MQSSTKFQTEAKFALACGGTVSLVNGLFHQVAGIISLEVTCCTNIVARRFRCMFRIVDEALSNVYMLLSLTCHLK